MATSSSLSSRVKGTWRILTKKDPTHCLVCWPEEEDSLSIVQVKIVSPRSDSLIPDTFCKVKGLEQFQCKVVALGSESEMKSVMTNVEMSMVEENDDDGDEPPPNKKLVLNQPRRPVKAKQITMQMNLPPKGKRELKQQRKTVKEAHRRAVSS